MDIKSALKKIDFEEKTIEKIGIFLKTKRGQTFVSKLHTASFKELCERFQAPSFLRLYRSDMKNKNMVLAAIKKYNVSTPKSQIVQTEYEITRTKCPVFLTKDEIRKIDSRRPKKKMGFAELMHAYEESMMNRFIKKHPAPTERELAEDLFPEELKAGYDNMLYIHREYVRNFLCKAYCHTMPKESFYRIFKVLSITEDPATGKKHSPVISEVEGDSMAYSHLDEKTPTEILHELVENLAKTVRNADKNVINVKIYNKYGALIDSKRC
jgi:hypothetical protein